MSRSRKTTVGFDDDLQKLWRLLNDAAKTTDELIRYLDERALALARPDLAAD